jgi:fibronectin type 3 domain-containing protein/type II secretory pathway pseudopilin PulG
MKKGFTLIELITILASLGIISSIVINIIKPLDIIKCSRDTQRINDLQAISSAIANYLSEIKSPDLDGPYFTNSGFDEATPTIFLSIPKDKQSTSSSLVFEGKTWRLIQASSTNLVQRINGEGWLPIDFLSLTKKPINILPLDPANTFNNNYFYSYAFKKSAKSYEINTNFECQKFKELAKNDGGDSELFEVGSDLNIIPPSLYGYTKTQLAYPSIKVSGPTNLSLTIGQSSSTKITISNTSSYAYLHIYQITQSNQNSFLKIDKNKFTIAPNNTTNLTLTCDGRSLKSSTTTNTTIFIWHNDPQQVNPYTFNFSCIFNQSPLLKINPKSAILETKTNGSAVTQKIAISNEGDDKITINLYQFLYKETTQNCPNYVEATTTDTTISGNSSVELIFTLRPTSTKQNFYCYQIITTDNSQYPTITIPVYVKITSPPKPPIINQIIPGDRKIILSWIRPDDNGGEEITNYEIYRDNTLIASTSYNVFVYEDTNVINGQKYCYKIKAINKVGSSDFSQSRCLIPGKEPSPPINFSITSSNRSNILSWQPPTDNGGSLIDSYLLYYRKQGETNWRFLFDFSAYPTTSYKFTHQDLINGQTYEYTIQAKNQFGVSNYATTVSATPRGYPIPPGKLQTSALANGIRLTWEPPLSNEGSAVSYYNIYRATSSQYIFIASTTATSYNDLSTASKTTYYYYITAVNSIGESKRSNIESGCYGNCSSPGTQCISPNNLSLQSLVNKISLSWEDGDAKDTKPSFAIYESTGDEYQLIGTTPANSFTRTGLINGKNYYYYVTKISGDFCDLESIPSNYVMGSPNSTPLFPLSLDFRETQESYTQLNWQPPISDEGAATTEYYLYKATSTPTSTYQLLATTTGLTYLDQDNSASTPIYYYVKAKNANGFGFKSNIVGRYNSQCFAKIYLPNNKNNNFNDVVKNNNQYLTVGWEWNNQNYNGVLYQLDSLGNPQAIKISSTTNESSFNFILASSSYFILGGQVKSGNNYDGLLVRISSTTFDTVWSKKIGGKKDEKIFAGILDGDEIILTGYSSSFGQGDNDIIFSLFNNNGVIKVFKTFGGLKNDVGQGLIKANDNGYIIVGYSNSFRKDYDVILIKVDREGKLIWQKIYDSGGNDFGMAIATSSSGYLIFGYSQFDANHYDPFAIAIDNQGQILWQKRYSAGGDDYLYKVKKDYDGNYIIIGKSNSYNNLNYDGLVMKINSTTGEIIFAKNIGWYNNDNFYGLEISSNDYYFIVGNSHYFTTGPSSYRQLALNISSSSDPAFNIFNKGNIQQKFLINIISPSALSSNFFHYSSNLKINSPDIQVLNYSLNFVSKILPDYENLANVCNVNDLFKKSFFTEFNLIDKRYTLFSRSGANYNYLSIDNFLDYLRSLSSFLVYIYRATSSDNYNYITNISGNYATDTSPLSGKNCYRSGLRSFFFVSNFSNEFCSATTSDKLRPTPPVDLSISTGSLSIVLEWQLPQYNGGENIQYYKIYRSTSTNEINNFILIAATTATSYTDNSVSEGINYCYYVTALNSIGESDKSLVKCQALFSGVLSTISPNLSYTSDSGIQLIWNGVSGVNYYVVYRNGIKIVTTTATSYIDYNYESKTNNNYLIEAINNQSTLITSGNNSIGFYFKLPPQNVRYTLGNNSITLNWASAGESGLLNYSIYRKIKGSSYGNSPYATTNTSTLSFTDNNLLAGESYCYVVKANYPNGETLPSNEICTTALTLPQPSFSIRQTGTFGAWLVIDKIENYSSKAGFGKIKEYRIYRATSSNYILLATNSPDNLNYIDLMSLATSATYTISAINEIGEGTSTPIDGVGDKYNKQAKFKYYKITTDNQIFEIGETFTSTLLGSKETGKKARNYAIYIEVIDPPKFINVVDINASTNNNQDKIKEYKFICDNRSYNLQKGVNNRLYNLNLICSKMFIILKWDPNLAENQIPIITINNITINQ